MNRTALASIFALGVVSGAVGGCAGSPSGPAVSGDADDEEVTGSSASRTSAQRRRVRGCAR